MRKTLVCSSIPVMGPLSRSTPRHVAICASTNEATSRTLADSLFHFFRSRMNSSTEEIMIDDLVSRCGMESSRSACKNLELRPSKRCYQRVKLPQKSGVALPGIVCQLFAVMGKVVEEGLHPFLVQCSPVRAVTSLVEPVRIENLFELMQHRDGEIRLAEMQGFRYQRESGVGHDCLCAGQVGEESVQRWFLVGDVFFLAFAAKAIRHKLTADGT